MNSKRQKSFIDEGRSRRHKLKRIFRCNQKKSLDHSCSYASHHNSCGIAYTHLNNTLLYQTSTRIILPETEEMIDMNTLW